MRGNVFSGLQLVQIIEGPDNRGCTVMPIGVSIVAFFSDTSAIHVASDPFSLCEGAGHEAAIVKSCTGAAEGKWKWWG